MLLVHGRFGYFFRMEIYSVSTQFRTTHRPRLPALRARGGETRPLGCEHAHSLPRCGFVLVELLKKKNKKTLVLDQGSGFTGEAICHQVLRTLSPTSRTHLVETKKQQEVVL